MYPICGHLHPLMLSRIDCRFLAKIIKNQLELGLVINIFINSKEPVNLTQTQLVI